MKIIIPALSTTLVVRKEEEEEDMGDSGTISRRLGEEQELQSLLSRKKLRLVLDLDHTLVHCTPVSKLTPQDSARMMSSAAAADIHYLDGGALVLKFRPGVRSFLEEASAMFDLSIYTMGTRHYANQVAARLVLDHHHQTTGGSSSLSFVEVISREDCTVEKQKGLDAVSSHRRAVVVVDDKVKVWAREDRDNVLTIAPYYFFGGINNNQLSGEEQEDRELGRVLEVLREVHSTFFRDDDYDDYYTSSMDAAQVLKRVRLLRLYHGRPPHYYPNMLHHHHHRRRRRRRRHEDKKEEEDGCNKIKKIKIVFGRATTTAMNLACQGNESITNEEHHDHQKSVAWGPIMTNQSRRHSSNNSIIRCRVNQLQACVR